jgi:hypothetical protein
MLNPITLVKALPTPYMWLGFLALLAAGWGHGYLTGALHEHDQFAKYAAETEALAAVQAKKVSATISKQKSVTLEVSNAYAQSLDALHRHYAGRVRKPSGSCALPAIPGATGEPDAGPADIGSGPAEFASIEACAVTTLQLIVLQDWITEQQSVER